MSAPRILLALLAAASVAAVGAQEVGTATIRGHVLDDTGRVVPGLTVRVGQLMPTGEVAYLPRAATLDEQGTFQVSGLAAGIYVLVTTGAGRLGQVPLSLPLPGIGPSAPQLRRVLRPGNPPVTRTFDFVTDPAGRFVEFGARVLQRESRLLTFVPTFAGNTTDARMATRLTLAAAETKTVDIVAQTRPAFLVTGQLIGVAPGGVINDALVTITRTDDDLPLAQAFTDFDGRFGVVAVPVGIVKVNARRGVCPRQVTPYADGWPGTFQCDVVREDSQRWSGTVTAVLDEQGRLMADGRPATQVTVVMTPAVLGPDVAGLRQPAPPHRISHGHGVLDGTLTDADGRPMRATHVAIFSADLDGVRATVTDDDGRFTFQDLPAAGVRLVASPLAGPATEYGQANPGGDGSLITIGDGAHLTVAWRLGPPSV